MTHTLVEALIDDEAKSLIIIQKAFEEAGCSRPFFGEAYEPGTVIASIVRQVEATRSHPVGDDVVEPTQLGDSIAEEMRAFYEANKGTRHVEGEADNLMLGLLNIVLTRRAAIQAMPTDDGLKPGSYFEAMKAANDEIQRLRAADDGLREALRELVALADECATFDRENLEALAEDPANAKALTFTTHNYWYDRATLTAKFAARAHKIADAALSKHPSRVPDIERPPYCKPHEFLLLASYCGDDNDACTEARPCADCLAMCNVFDEKGAFLRELGRLANPPCGEKGEG